jgi:hypothetical protein
MLAQIEPHRSYLETGLPSHIFVRFDDLHSLIEREGLQLEGGWVMNAMAQWKNYSRLDVRYFSKKLSPNRVRKKRKAFRMTLFLEHYHVAPVVREDGLVHQSFEN